MSQVVVAEKKKRGRKKQNVVLQVESTTQEGGAKSDASSPVNIEEDKPPPKKRGRKPKGGKIIPQTDINTMVMIAEPNVILHLKCSIKDISTSFQETFQYDPNVESIQSFNFNENNTVNYLEGQTTSSDLMNDTLNNMTIVSNMTGPSVSNVSE